MSTINAGTTLTTALSLTGDTSGTLSLATSGTTRMTIDGSGNVGIGGTASAFAKVHVLGTLPTSSNSTQGFRMSGEIPSGTTTVARSYLSFPSTAAASFTLTDLYHFEASQGTFGAGSAVTNQYGFVVAGSLTGATNNYGFYSNIASGTNRWNFYAAGTAQNYFAGNTGVGNTDPGQYATSGKVFNITGTANNSGPANLYLSGSTNALGRGFNSTEVFAINGITSASEISRITGTGSNGFRAYLKIIVTGHSGGVGNGTNIKEYYWDGGVAAPTQISTYTDGNVPAISFDNSTSNVCIIKLASSNGSASFNGVMKIEWLIPVDFSSNTWTIS